MKVYLSKERELLKVAVIALEDAHFKSERDQAVHLRASVIKQLKDALAQPEHEADRRSDPISKLRNLRDIQGRKGNYDIDEYMRGLFNGLELSLSIFEDRSPDYKEHIAQRELLTQKREPLSKKDIRTIVNQLPSEVDLRTAIEFCRIIEKAHGITGGGG